MTARLAISGLLLCGALAGCGVLPGLESQEPAPWTQAGARPPASDVDNLLAYFQHIRKVPAAELGKEHEAARQAFLSSRTDLDRVRLAMLLSLPGSALSDEPRALELLDPVAKNPGGKFYGLAVLLAANLQERRRLDANTQGLQQKLDALMSLERNMIERKR
jgi:hypothetical protein